MRFYCYLNTQTRGPEDDHGIIEAVRVGLGEVESNGEASLYEAVFEQIVVIGFVLIEHGRWPIAIDLLASQVRLF